jgi:hypothetical protein
LLFSLCVQRRKTTSLLKEIADAGDKNAALARALRELEQELGGSFCAPT